MALLVVGVRESARANTVMVILKLAILVFLLVAGVTAFNGDNFIPWGANGLKLSPLKAVTPATTKKTRIASLRITMTVLARALSRTPTTSSAVIARTRTTAAG